MQSYKTLTPHQLDKIIEFTQAELRSRFDTTSSNLLAIDTIEEARMLGFTQLGEEMIRDLATSQDDMSEQFIRRVIAAHEEKQQCEYEPPVGGEGYPTSVPAQKFRTA